MMRSPREMQPGPYGVCNMGVSGLWTAWAGTPGPAVFSLFSRVTPSAVWLKKPTMRANLLHLEIQNREPGSAS